MKQIKKVSKTSFETSGYELPIASAETLGGIKVGANLTIDEDGVLSANSSGSSLDIYPITEKIIVGKHNGKDVYRQFVTGRFTESYANEYWCNTSITNIERILNYNGSVFLSEDDTGVAFGFHYGARLVALTPNGKLRVDAISTDFANKYFECWFDFTEKE